jgi:hypothetical protein
MTSPRVARIGRYRPGRFVRPGAPDRADTARAASAHRGDAGPGTGAMCTRAPAVRARSGYRAQNMGPWRARRDSNP